MSHKDDPEMLNAVHVLADAVRRERIPGVVEFRQLEDALKNIGDAPDETQWATADAAFNALDPDLRQRVADRAQQLAHKEAKTRREGGAPPSGDEPSPPAAAAKAIPPVVPASNVKTEPVTVSGPNTAAKPGGKANASPFLTALNRGRLGGR